MGIQKPTLEGFYRICKEVLRVADKEGNGIVPLSLRTEQLRVAQALLRDESQDRLCVAKSRQIGSSTVIAALMAVVAMGNPGIKCGITANTEAIGKSLLEMVYKFLHQLGAPICQKTGKSITIGDIDGDPTLHTSITLASTATSGKSKSDLHQVFAGQNLAFAWVSEMAFYENASAFSSISAAAEKGIILVESTPNGTTRAGESFYRLFTAPGEGWERVFFSMEESDLYTRDPQRIDDETWEEARAAYGFTSRVHASWWLNKRDSEGLTDVQMFRQYPVTEEQCWNVQRESFFTHLPDLATLQRAIPVEVGYFKVWDVPRSDAALIAGVDCALGRKKDSSAISVVELGTGRLIASYKSNEVEVDQFVKVMEQIEGHLPISEFVIESNNMGGWVAEKAEIAGLAVRTKNTNNTPVGAMTRIKNLVRRGILKGGEELEEECRDLVLTERGKFSGKKDLLMSLTMVIEESLDWEIDVNPAVKESGKFYLEDALPLLG